MNVNGNDDEWLVQISRLQLPVTTLPSGASRCCCCWPVHGPGNLKSLGGNHVSHSGSRINSVSSSVVDGGSLICDSGKGELEREFRANLEIWGTCSSCRICRELVLSVNVRRGRRWWDVVLKGDGARGGGDIGVFSFCWEDLRLGAANEEDVGPWMVDPCGGSRGSDMEEAISRGIRTAEAEEGLRSSDNIVGGGRFFR